MNEEQIKEVFSDEEFVKSLLAMETAEEVQTALEEKNINLTVDEIKKIGELMKKKADGELTDENLENVAGGSVAMFIIMTTSIAVGAALGAAGGHYVMTRRW